MNQVLPYPLEVIRVGMSPNRMMISNKGFSHNLAKCVKLLTNCIFPYFNILSFPQACYLMTAFIDGINPTCPQHFVQFADVRMSACVNCGFIRCSSRCSHERFIAKLPGNNNDKNGIAVTTFYNSSCFPVSIRALRDFLFSPFSFSTRSI